MTFTHDHVNDTTLENIGDCILFEFKGESGDEEFAFYIPQRKLLQMLEDFFSYGDHKATFEDMTMNAQDALYNALALCEKDNIEL